MTYPVTEHPKGTYLDEYFNPAQAGRMARYRVDNVQTESGVLVGAAVPLPGDGIKMVLSRQGHPIPLVEG